MAQEKSLPMLMIGDSEVLRSVISISWQIENRLPPITASVTGSIVWWRNSIRGIPGGTVPRQRNSVDALRNQRPKDSLYLVMLPHLKSSLLLQGGGPPSEFSPR